MCNTPHKYGKCYIIVINNFIYSSPHTPPAPDSRFPTPDSLETDIIK
ncbi:hypothetical protein [Moorena sp. SIO3H5]|nr:hypothetical protein [Moorena sp. SIO3H5]NEO70545.1 hypothetical protein [Moorena sp. SIO3H5]